MSREPNLEVTAEVAQRVRTLRSRYGWSAQTLAERCSEAGAPTLSRSAIAKIETGRRQALTAAEAQTISEILGVTLDYLVNGEEDDPVAERSDSVGPIFYLSYRIMRSSSSTASAEAVQKLFHDLTVNVGELVPRRYGQSVAAEAAELSATGDWAQRILHAAGSCHVFVALLSPNYFDSEWCAMECDLFSGRPTTRTNDPSNRTVEAPIIPVVWAPTLTEVPHVVNRVQRFVPELPADIQALYQKNGLFGLQRMRHPAYDAVVWALSLQIQHMYHTFKAEPVSKGFERLRRSFDGLERQ